MTKKKQSSFYLTDELVKAVGLRAVQDDCDKSEVVCRALTEYLEKELNALRILASEEGGLDLEHLKITDNWGYALGMMKIDVDPSQDFMDEVKREVKGEITLEDMDKSWEKRWVKKDEDADI